MRYTGLVFVLSMVLGISLGEIARGGDCGCSTSTPAAASCGQQYVTQKVCVPAMFTEERTCTEIVCVPETRTRKVTCCELVPVTKMVPCTYTVMVPQVRKRMETYCAAMPVTREVTETYQVQVPTFKTVETNYTVCVPVWTDKTEQCTVWAPSCETRQGVRCETHCVPVKETRMHCVDKGHWEDQPIPACGPCDPCGKPQNVRMLGFELGERAGGGNGQQAGDGPGAMHLPGPGLQAPGPDPHGQGVPL